MGSSLMSTTLYQAFHTVHTEVLSSSTYFINDIGNKFKSVHLLCVYDLKIFRRITFADGMDILQQDINELI